MNPKTIGITIACVIVGVLLAGALFKKNPFSSLGGGSHADGQ